MDPGHTRKLNLQMFPTVLLSARLCGTNREQIFRLPKSSRTMVCAVSLLMPNSSAINLSVRRRSCASICRTFWGSACAWSTRTWLILSRFLPFTKAFEPFVNTFSAHGFPPVHLYQHFTHLRCSFPQFVAELEVCALLHCAVTLPITLTTFNWPQSVYTVGHTQSMLCVDSPHVSEEPCVCEHTSTKVPFRYDTIHRTI